MRVPILGISLLAATLGLAVAARAEGADEQRQCAATSGLTLDQKLSAILAKKEKPRDAQEQIELGAFCSLYKRRHAAAVSFYSDAFADEPKLAEDLREQHRYHAACAAALAAAGMGEDAKNLSPEQRGKLRQQALEWRRADLTAYTKHAEKDNQPARQAVHQRLSHWLQDANLATVRETKALAALPEQERNAWQQLWAEVAALLKKCQ